jgi:hypothetical protein
MLADRPMLTQGSMPAGRADDFLTERVNAGRQADVDQRSMPAGRADDLPTGRSMPAGRADELPTERLMLAGRADVMPVSVVDANRKVDEWRILKCPEKPECKQSELQKEPKIRKNIGTRQSRRLTRPEKHRNTGKSRNFRNTESSTQAEDTREP